MKDISEELIKKLFALKSFRDPLRIKEIKEEDESHILIHSLRDANMPKFLAEDVPLFESILDDLFPGVTPPEPDQGALEVSLFLVEQKHIFDILSSLFIFSCFIGKT